MRRPGSDDWEVVNDYPVKDTEFTVDNLDIGKPYEFRVKAKNAAGWGDYATLDRPVTLKPDCRKSHIRQVLFTTRDLFLVAPSSPGTPQVKKVGKDYVELAWEEPTTDGGSKVLGYVVEKRLAGTDQWVKALPYTVLDNNVMIGDLPENGEMEFRVRAVNKAGEGEPSASTGRVKITEYPSKL